ncbi:MAG: hypothetical protein ACPLYF_03955 [Fervidobacterium sp.]
MSLAIVSISVILVIDSHISSLRNRVIILQNKLAEKDSLTLILNNTYTRLATINENIKLENSQLKEIIDKDKARIQTLIQLKNVTVIDSIYPKVDSNTFYYHDDWLSLRGSINIEKNHVRGVMLGEVSLMDSLSVIVTQNSEGIIRGYIQNTSPYVKITNANFMLRSEGGETSMMKVLLDTFRDNKTGHLKPTTYIYAAGTGASIGLLSTGKLKGTLIGIGLGLATTYILDYLIQQKNSPTNNYY